MADAQLQDQIDSAQTYSDLLVPALFQEWAPRVVDGAHIKEGDTVLDVACGTGVVTKEAIERGAIVTGFDLNPGMLEVAQKNAPGAQFQQGDACDMPFNDDTFDAITCMYGLMYFPDRAKALSEMKRVLKPGGKVSIVVWDSIENTPAYECEAKLIEKMAGADAGYPVRFPFSLGDQAALKSLVAEAGFKNVAVKATNGKGHFPTINDMLDGDLRGWLPVMGVNLEEEMIQSILAEAPTAFATFIQPDGSVLFDSPALIVTGAKL